MKASIATALAWAACTMASPLALHARGHAGTHCSCETETVTITVPPEVHTAGPSSTPCTETQTATMTATLPEHSKSWTEPTPETTPWTTIWSTTSTWNKPATGTDSETWTKPTETTSWTKPVIETSTAIKTSSHTATNTVTQTGTPVPPASTGCEGEKCHGTGHLVQDLGPQVDRLLTVTGTDGQNTLVQVNEDVYNLLSGRVGLGESVGEIIGDAATAGDLVADLGPIVNCILTIVGDDSKSLLVRLAPDLADLLRGAGITLGLDSIQKPIGNLLKPVNGLLKPVNGLLGSLGLNLKRDEPSHPFKIHDKTGHDQEVLIKGPVGDKLHEKGITGVIGAVTRVSISLTELVKDLGPETDNLLVVLGRETGYLLIRLDPAVAQLVNTLLPHLGRPLGKIVKTVGESL